MIYLLAALCIAILVLALLYYRSTQQTKRYKSTWLEELDKRLALEKILERTKQREEIDYSNMGLTDTELDERLQNDYRD